MESRFFFNEEHDRIFRLVGEVADAYDIEVYVVGGYVRDRILERPSTDIDIVAVGSGIELAKKIAERAGVKKVSYFKSFGTAHLSLYGCEVEIVGARRESYSRNSRKPVVEDGTLEDDQKRRDFTINALAISLNKKNYGQLIDPFQGIADLESKIIRTPLDPETTFSDDPLRMVRAVRFASQLGFRIEASAYKALCDYSGRLSIVSVERIMDEFNKILMVPKPSYGIRLLFNTGLMSVFFPSLAALKGVELIDGKGHKDNFEHTLQVLDNISVFTNNLWLRWAALLHDIGKPSTKHFVAGTGWTFYGHEVVGTRMVQQIFRQLKLPMNEKMKYVQKLVLLHLRPMALVDDNVTDSAVRRLLFDADEVIEDLMLLAEADITSKNDEKVKRYLKNFEIVRRRLKEVEEKDRIRNWQPPLTGEEIMAYFGLSPCKFVGDIKNEIKDAILDGRIPNDKSAAFDLMIELGKSMGLTKKV